MADTKISALTTVTSLADNDLFAIVDDPAGTPASRSTRVDSIKSYIESNANQPNYWPQTASESALGITPSDTSYEPGNVKRFGAVGDGSTDDTTAFKKALACALAVSYTSSIGNLPTVWETKGNNVFLPAGAYRITGNLSDLSTYLTKGRMQGVKIHGVKMKSIIFADAGDGTFIFDNYTGTPFRSYGRMSFEDLVIAGGTANSDAATASSFMQNWSDGQSDKYHNFSRCHFINLKQVVVTQGSTNADVMTFENCRFQQIYTNVLATNNNESICHWFYQCEAVACYCDAVIDCSGGGGNVVWNGGSIVNGYAAASDGKDSAQYVINASGSTQGNNRFVFANVRFESPSIYSLLVFASDYSQPARVTFENCNWSGIVDPGTTRTVVVLKGQQYVEFVRCQLPLGTAKDTFIYSLESTSNDQGANLRPSIRFIDCEIPDFNSSHYTFVDNSHGGRVVATGCYEQRIDTIVPGADTVAKDFNWPAGFGGAGIKSASAVIHRVALFREGTAWPYNSSSAYNEKTVQLPDNATILRIVAYKPAQGADSTTYELSVGTDDKTTVHGTSTEGQYDAEHEVLVNDLNFRVGTDANKKIVRLWNSSTTSDTFVDGDVTTGTDRITMTTHPFVNSDPVRLYTTGTLPTGLAVETTYYVKKIDANTIELYSDSGLTSIVDITAAAGGGTHSIYIHSGGTAAHTTGFAFIEYV